ncbi:hypothetical protein HDU67_003530, partial [Dinochytrium kinnereticum]
DWMRDAISLPTETVLDQESLGNEPVKSRRSVSMSRATNEMSRTKSTRTFHSQRSAGSERSRGSSTTFPFLFAFQDAHRRESNGRSPEGSSGQSDKGTTQPLLALRDRSTSDPSSSNVVKERAAQESPEGMSRHSELSDVPTPVPLAAAGKDLRHRKSQDILRSFISPASSPLRLLSHSSSSSKGNGKLQSIEPTPSEPEELSKSNFFDMFLNGTLPIEYTDSKNDTSTSPTTQMISTIITDEDQSEITATGTVTETSESTQSQRLENSEARQHEPKIVTSEYPNSAELTSKRSSVFLGHGNLAQSATGDRPRFNFFGKKKPLESEDINTSQQSLARVRSSDTRAASTKLEPPQVTTYFRRASEPQLGSPAIPISPPHALSDGTGADTDAGPAGSSPDEALALAQSPTIEGKEASSNVVTPWEDHGFFVPEPARTGMVGSIVGTMAGATHAVGGAVSGAAGSLVEAASNVKRRLRRDRESHGEASGLPETILLPQDLSGITRRSEKGGVDPIDLEDSGAADVEAPGER